MAVIVPARLKDVVFVAEHMRRDDRLEIFCQWPSENAQSLARSAVMSSPRHCYAALVKETPAAVFGAGEIHPGLWGAWAFGTDRMRRAMPQATRFIRNVMTPRLLRSGARRVEARSLASHAVAHAWLENLGAVRECDLPDYGKHGERFVLFAWRRSDFPGRSQQS